MSSEDFDFIAFYEGYKISLKPGKKKPTNTEQYDLLGILWTLTSVAEEGQSIDFQCDIVRIPPPASRKLSALIKKSPKGRIAFTEMKMAVQPYIFGEKALE